MSWQRFVVMIGIAAVTASAACSSSSSDAAGSSGATNDPVGRDKATVAKGEEAVVKNRACVTCHGDNMAGKTTRLVKDTADNMVPANVDLYPPNLTPDIETGLGDPKEPDPARRGYTDELLARAIKEGYDKTDQQLCPQMKHYPTMTDFEVYSIVLYLRSLPAVKQKIPGSICPPLKNKSG